MALPERQYYTLEKAVKMLKCDVEDLIHHAANGELEICVRINKQVCFGEQGRRNLEVRLPYDNLPLPKNRVNDRLYCIVKTIFGEIHLDHQFPNYKSHLASCDALFAFDKDAIKKQETRIAQDGISGSEFFYLPRHYPITIVYQNDVRRSSSKEDGEGAVFTEQTENVVSHFLLPLDISIEDAQWDPSLASSFWLEDFHFSVSDLLITSAELRRVQDSSNSAAEETTSSSVKKVGRSAFKDSPVAQIAVQIAKDTREQHPHSSRMTIAEKLSLYIKKQYNIAMSPRTIDNHLRMEDIPSAKKGSKSKFELVITPHD